MKGTDLRLSPKTREVLDWLDARRRETDPLNRTSVLEWGGLRGRGISTPDGESHRLTVASADPADPREGRGVVVRGSDE